MTTEDNNGSKRSRLLEELRRLRANADKGREPELLSSRMGTRMYSLGALLERIITAFNEEHAGSSDAFREADTESKRLKLLLATVEYVLAVESINVSRDDKAEIMRRAYAELFTYGPLDALFDDERVTTITLEGADKASVRYGHGELTALEPLFEDEAHLRKVVRRLMIDAGADLLPDEPMIETGLRVRQRPVCVSVVTPPVTVQMSADIRVHPAEPPALDELVASGYMTAAASHFLRALVESEHGFVVVGDTESGKTVLLGTLARLLPQEQRQRAIAVERAGEMHLPPEVGRLVVQWHTAEREGITFGQQIAAALEKEPSVLLLDEVRADEAPSILPLLTGDNTLRQIWAFRGPADHKRLASALGMLARRSDPTQSEALVRPLYERLPFVITVRRRQGSIHVYSISEWQFWPGSDYPEFVELLATGEAGIATTGKHPMRSLPLPDDFWD
jgi:Flp pilus assembly CpaF family ATPase